MRIAIMGSGGLGGFYGGQLARHGYDVSFIARGNHLNAIRKKGLRLVGPEDNYNLENVFATDRPAEIGFVDVILFCVKLYDVEEASNLIKPIIKNETVIISALNGINGPERLHRIVKKGLVFGGSARVSTRISEPGVISYLGKSSGHKLTFGNSEKLEPQIALKFCRACQKSNFPAEISKNIEVELWDKLVQLTCVAGLTSLTRKPIGIILEDPYLFNMAKRILREVELVARSNGIDLEEGIVEKKMELIGSFPKDLYASMYHDLMLGKKMEVEGVFGYLSQLGKRFSLDTPIIDFLYAFLRLHMNGC